MRSRSTRGSSRGRRSCRTGARCRTGAGPWGSWRRSLLATRKSSQSRRQCTSGFRCPRRTSKHCGPPSPRVVPTWSQPYGSAPGRSSMCSLPAGDGIPPLKATFASCEGASRSQARGGRVGDANSDFATSIEGQPLAAGSTDCRSSAACALMPPCLRSWSLP